MIQIINQSLMKRKKILFVGFAIFASFLIFSMIKNKLQSDWKSEKIIGASLPLTGQLASYGEAFRNGMVMAKEELGEKAKGFEIIFEDNAYDSQKAISAFLRLKQINRVDIVVNWGDATAYAVAPIVKNNPVPFLAAGATNADLTSYSPYSIRYFDRANHFMEKLWEYFRENNLKNIAIVKTDIVYFNNMYEALNRGKQADETVELLDSFLPGQQSDFKTSIAKLKNQKDKLDALGVFLMPGQVGQFYKQARQLGLNMPFFAAESSFEGDPEIINDKSLIAGVVYPTWKIDEKFKKNYASRFGSIAQIEHAAQGYDLVNILITAINFTNADTIIHSLKQIKDFPGAEGPYTYKEYNGDQYFESPVYLKIVNE